MRLSNSIKCCNNIFTFFIFSILKPYISEVVRGHQCWFRHNCWTADQIFCIRQIAYVKNVGIIWYNTILQALIDCYKPEIQFGRKFCVMFSAILVYLWLYSTQICLNEIISKIHNLCTFICFLIRTIWNKEMFYRHCFIAFLHNMLLGRLMRLRRHWNWMKKHHLLHDNYYLLDLNAIEKTQNLYLMLVMKAV
jgi:hypothetical protein